MAFKSNGSIIVTNDRAFDNLANVTIQNSGNLTITSADTFQGTVAGYTSGGIDPGLLGLNVIDKFPFASDTNSTDVGDLTQGRWGPAGHSSSISGYTSGGSQPTPQYNTIDKFPFSTNNNATDVGDLPNINRRHTGHSSSTNGYASHINPTRTNYVKFPFAVDTNATNAADLTFGGYGAAGQNSTTSGYNSGGYKFSPPPANMAVNTIEKFPFATDTNATDIGDLTVARAYTGSGQSSTTHGYTTAGINPAPPAISYNTIDKFPFSSDTNATDVGDLTQARYLTTGQSSTLSGYTSSGSTLAPTNLNTVDKFPFSSDTNATDVGDLTVVRNAPAGQQD